MDIWVDLYYSDSIRDIYTIDLVLICFNSINIVRFHEFLRATWYATHCCQEEPSRSSRQGNHGVLSRRVEGLTNSSLFKSLGVTFLSVPFVAI